MLSIFTSTISCLISQTFPQFELSSARCGAVIYKKVADFIDLDKGLFVEKSDLKDPKECFKFLRSLKDPELPDNDASRGESSSSVVIKATLFNKFFGSVYSGKQCYQCCPKQHRSHYCSN